MTNYVKVATTSELSPGQMMRVEAHGDQILLVNIDDQFYAVCDTCSHEDASLYRGALRGEYIRCPLHGSRFNVKTGEAMEEPAEEPLTVYTVKVEGKDVLVAAPDQC